ncbi:MAG: CHAT domain-containing protein, partial [bacterium]|nr:CHAT domain-containing protein [bacterium]
AKFSEDVEQLALVGGDGNMTLIGADEFSELFSRHQPGIVVLQACESGTLSGSQSFRGIASRIVQQNVPVLVAMQYRVSNSTATQFALEFYRRLAENDPVDKAVQEGRRRIAISRTGYNSRDFATPLLFMRVRDGHIFQRQAGSLDETELKELKDEAERLSASQKFDEAVKHWKEIRDFGPDNNDAESKIMELQQQKLRNLQQTARRMELNQAYPDAISVWQEISLSASEAQSAEREIERLQEQQRQHGSIQDIQQQLMRRMGEIKPIYFSVAKRLKQIQKEGIVDDDSEILVNMVRQFLLQNLSSQDLTEMWQEAIGAPSVKKEVIEYTALVERLQRGEIIPVFGSEIHYHSGLLPLSAR